MIFRNFFSLTPLLLVVLVFFMSGCAALIVGGTLGAVGGYAVGQDTIQGETDESFDSLWDASVRVSEIMGTIKSQDRLKGRMQVEIDKSNVNIEIDQLTEEAVRLRVSARRYLMPNTKLAQKVFIKIMQQAR